MTSDRPSPVRASAQEQRMVAVEAKTLWLAIARAEQEVFEDELTYVSVAPLIIAALSAAEARGRQQAEQARDAMALALEYQKSIAVPHARSQGGADGFQAGWHAALTRIADTPIDELRALVPEPPTDPRFVALTQALKDYGQHKDGCRRLMSKIPCTCGLNAALTGAQA